MKIIIEIKQTERGDVAITFGHDSAPATNKEAFFHGAILEIVRMGIPIICEAMGGKGFEMNDPTNG